MRTSIALVIAVLLVGAHGGPSSAQDAPEPEMPWAIGGVGGAYLLVEPGELEIELFKRDLNETNVVTDFRVILAGPDREVLHDVVIPHLGGRKGDPWGPVQHEVLRSDVDRPGIYALNISTKGDRYGLNLAWGMRTNAAGYVVETARGHRDVEHEEPIVLLDTERPAEIGFLPRPGAFEIEVEALPPNVDALTLLDDAGSIVVEIPVVPEQRTRLREYLRVPIGNVPEGSASYVVPADAARGSELLSNVVDEGIKRRPPPVADCAACTAAAAAS